MRTPASAALTWTSIVGAAAALPNTTYSMNPRPLTEKNCWQPTWSGSCVRSAAGEKSCSFNGQGTVADLANSGVAADSPVTRRHRLWQCRVTADWHRVAQTRTDMRVGLSESEARSLPRRRNGAMAAMIVAQAGVVAQCHGNVADSLSLTGPVMP